MKHIFIVNSISGKGSGLKIAPLIDEVCKELNIPYEIAFTKNAKDPLAFAKEYSKDESNIIYAVGGDGTLYEVLNGINPKNVLGIIPAGSGNDFVRYYNEKNSDKKEMIRHVILDEPKPVDVGSLNGNLFINTASMGMDAKINDDASHMIRKTFLTKEMAYIFSIISNVIILKAVKIKLLVDGKDLSGSYYIVNCMNGRFYGNGVESSPYSKTDDGLFNLILFPESGRMKTYIMLVRFLNRAFDSSKAVSIMNCKNIDIESNEDMHCQTDGENFISRKLSIRMHESYIKIKTP